MDGYEGDGIVTISGHMFNRQVGGGYPLVVRGHGDMGARQVDPFDEDI